MKKSTCSLLLAGLLAGAGFAQAQTATATSDVPVQAGEASTLSNGVPNAKTTNSPYADGTPVVVTPGVVVAPMPPTIVADPVVIDGAMHKPISREAIRQDAHGLTNATSTSNVPSRAGEASTMTNGVPNMTTSNPAPTEMGASSAHRVYPGVVAQ